MDAQLGLFQEALRQKLEQYKDIELAFTQPIDMRVSEMLSGVRAALAIKVYGDDLTVLEEKSKQIEELAAKVPGAVDIVRPPVLGQQYLQVEIRPEWIARYGIKVENINRLIETAVGGKVATEVIEASRRTGVLVRFPEAARTTRRRWRGCWSRRRVAPRCRFRCSPTSARWMVRCRSRAKRASAWRWCR